MRNGATREFRARMRFRGARFEVQFDTQSRVYDELDADLPDQIEEHESGQCQRDPCRGGRVGSVFGSRPVSGGEGTGQLPKVEPPWLAPDRRDHPRRQIQGRRKVNRKLTER